MSDIFISYASEDRSRVQSLARALERMGWSVWWDRRIPTGRSFDEVIQEALDAAKSVIVVWTKTSVKSQWVKNEARTGLRQRVLFPVMLLEEVEIPLEFGHLQAAHLMDWQPEEAHSGFEQFVQDIAQVLGPPLDPVVQQAPVKPPREYPPSQTKPASKIEPLSDRAGQLEQDGGLLERKPSTPTAISAPLDSPVESSSSLAGMQSQEPAQIHMPGGEGRVSEATDSTSPPQPQRYILIGIGLLLVMGAYVAYWILSLGPSPMKSDGPPAQTTLEQSSLRRAQEVTGKDDAPMVLIPAGEFWMGSPDDEGGKNEHPRHRVYLDAYDMDKFEVTVSRYADFLQLTGRQAPRHWDQVKTGKHSNLPVILVNWHDAEAYCRWVGKRLPTEAEWEKAARGTDGRTYPWGNNKPTTRLGNFIKKTPANAYDERLAPAESYEEGQSPYGLHQMAGNVWEWTADWYDEHFYAASPQRNPTGPLTGTYKVIRGGSWDDEPVDVRSAYRGKYQPMDRYDNIGFRCAQDRPK